MADNNPFLHHSFPVEHRRSHLPKHPVKGFFCLFRIIRCLGIPGRQGAVHIFEIRQVNIHEPLHPPQGFFALVTAAVVDHRKLQTLIHGSLQRFGDPRRIMGRRHQINIMGALLLKLQKNLCQPFPGDPSSGIRPGDGRILAVNAPERTSAEKHGSGTSLSGNTGFLPEMQRRPRRIQFCRNLAEAGLSMFPVRPAVSRAEPAAGISKQGSHIRLPSPPP